MVIYYFQPFFNCYYPAVNLSFTSFFKIISPYRFCVVDREKVCLQNEGEFSLLEHDNA
ncbi:hypothetical protein UYSO10_1601 [Kosakonia radicincitans]|nr:hypothetical protein UYSO10_1601 [Kosakonia radicincitans]